MQDKIFVICHLLKFDRSFKKYLFVYLKRQSDSERGIKGDTASPGEGT